MKKTKQKVSTGRAGAPVIMSLEYIQAKKDFEKFGGLSRADFESKLRSMSDCDISNFMPKLGIRPCGERRTMIMAIMKKYDEASVIFKRQESIAATPQNNLEPTASVQDNYRDFVEKFKV